MIWEDWVHTLLVKCLFHTSKCPVTEVYDFEFTSSFYCYLFRLYWTRAFCVIVFESDYLIWWSTRFSSYFWIREPYADVSVYKSWTVCISVFELKYITLSLQVVLSFIVLQSAQLMCRVYSVYDISWTAKIPPFNFLKWLLH